MTSQGEQKIIDILQKFHINFIREYTFKDLKSRKQRPLRYDFALFDNKEKLFALLEFDGEGHFRYNKFFHKTFSKFKYRQEMDLIKNQYALTQNIPLFRIPYYDLEKLVVYDDLFQCEYRVTNKWHNHLLSNKIKKQT